jgi:hypothetical protein
VPFDLNHVADGIHHGLGGVEFASLAEALTESPLISRLQHWAGDDPNRQSLLSETVVSVIRWRKSVGVPATADHREAFDGTDLGAGKVVQEPWRDAPLAPGFMTPGDDEEFYWVPFMVFPVSSAENAVIVSMTQVPWTDPGLDLFPVGSHRELEPAEPQYFGYVKGYGDENHQPVALPEYEVILRPGTI